MGYAFDLADFLTWKATGSAQRSNCTLTAKWNFLAQEKTGWQTDYLAVAGLSDLVERAGLPELTVQPGGSMGTLTPDAAAELGLDCQCHVAPGMIDAYAGALGALGGSLQSDVGRHVALIAGTSSCLVALSEEQMPGQSLWGLIGKRYCPITGWSRAASLRQARFSIISSGCMLQVANQIRNCTVVSSAVSWSCVPEKAIVSPIGCMSCPISTATGPLGRSSCGRCH